MQRFLQHQGIYAMPVPYSELKSIFPQVYGDQYQGDSDLQNAYFFCTMQLIN